MTPDPKQLEALREMVQSKGATAPELIAGRVSDMIDPPRPGSVWEDLTEYGNCIYQITPGRLTIMCEDIIVFRCAIERNPS